MRAVIQRVTRASVSVDGQVVSAVGKGYMVLLGVSVEDDEADARYIADKIVNLRIFEDDGGKMNKSLADVDGGVLLISQFTLYGDARHGRRPGFTQAARPETAIPLYERVAERIIDSGVPVGKGVFGADMAVELVNDGPVTILLDSKKTF